MRRAIPFLLPLCLVAQERPAIQEFVLANGLRVRLAEGHDSPALNIRLVIRPGGVEDQAGQSQWLANLMNVCGAGPYLNHAALVRAQEDAGLRLKFTHSPGEWTWTVNTESRFQDQALEHVAHAAFRPLWDAATAERLRDDRAESLRNLRPEEWAEGRFKSLLGLREAEPASPEAMKALTLGDLDAFRLRILRPDRALLVLQGDLTLSQAKQMALLHFGAFSGSSSKAKALQPASPDPVVIHEDVGQLHVWLGASLSTDSLEIAQVARLAGFVASRSDHSKMSKPLTTMHRGFEPTAGCAGLWIHATAPPDAKLDLVLQAVRSEWNRWCGELSAEAAYSRARNLEDAETKTRSLHPDRLLDRLCEETGPNGTDRARFQTVIKAWMEASSTRSVVLSPESKP